MAWSLNTIFSAVTVSGRPRKPVEVGGACAPRLPNDPTLYREWPRIGAVVMPTRLARRDELAALRRRHELLA